MYKPLFRDAQEAFQNAIARGVLTTTYQAMSSYAGHWMYMHTETDGRDAFKHRETRRYLRVKNEPIKVGAK